MPLRFNLSYFTTRSLSAALQRFSEISTVVVLILFVCYVALQYNAATFEDAVTRSVGRWCLGFMVAGAVSVFAAFAANGYDKTQPLLCWASTWAGAVAGERYGRLACYSRGASLITKSGAEFNIDFWHPDNAGGVLPFSNFYLYTMFLAAIPAFWLASWWVLIPHLAPSLAQLRQLAHGIWRYVDWRNKHSSFQLRTSHLYDPQRNGARQEELPRAISAGPSDINGTA
jgi:hypothetical protein